jgi:hypothetical protein
MAQQTTVEWLAKNLKDFPHIKHSQSFKQLIEQAKQMEKEQIIKAYNTYYSQEAFIDGEYLKGEQYYKKIYEMD